jgi:mono/diheme cytochrome c family protein
VCRPRQLPTILITEQKYKEFLMKFASEPDEMKLNLQLLCVSSAAAALLAVSGCGKPDATTPTQVAGKNAAAPKPVPGPPPFSEFAVPPKPAVTSELLAHGKTLYAQNCAACHGVNGDGKGDAAAFLVPRPRDFVKANFRLRSTAMGNLPTDVDLFREVSLGLPGTPMPPWKRMLNDNDRWALVEYLKTFSPRFADSNEVRTALADFGTPPAKSPATIARGKDLYTQMNCASCHGDSGRGDGPGAVALVDDSGTKIKPRDFTNPSVFKGGYSSKEIVRTILTGFNGTPMIGFHGALSNEDAWALAYYVETFAKPGATALKNPSSRSFLANEELGAPDVKINVTERAWKFDPEVIRVKKGQIVEITFEPTDNGLGAGHGLGISGYDENVFLNGAMVGVPKVAKFRADHAGSFPFYCATQCSTEKLHPLMHGTLVVEDDSSPKQTASLR